MRQKFTFKLICSIVFSVCSSLEGMVYRVRNTWKSREFYSPNL